MSDRDAPRGELRRFRLGKHKVNAFGRVTQQEPHQKVWQEELLTTLPESSSSLGTSRFMQEDLLDG